MESDNYNFDATLGGSEHLPHSANSLKFAASRSIEIAAMTESILRPSKTKLIFQSLPVHMRRRVMSHNCKRLPRRLRQGHFEQLKKSGLPPKQKRPSRKFRRRPGNLLKEYQRRQRTAKWLESHIWHAKRFHMVERWGYKLAYAPCDKAFRACYRASSAHCLLQDMSYLECVQITGPFNIIKSNFETITRPVSGLGVCARAYSSGNREGSVHIYKPGDDKNSYVGKVDFVWKPEEDAVTTRTLWLFVHPSFYQEMCDLLIHIFSTSYNDVPKKRKKLDTGVLLDEQIKIIQLKQKLNRLRLTGPKSHAVLTKALKFIDNLNNFKEISWIKHVDVKSLKLQEKKEYWDELMHMSSPGEMPPHIVIGAVVCDPRLVRPDKRTKAQINKYIPTSSRVLSIVPPHASVSPLWNSDIHRELLSNKWSDGQLIAYATKHQLIPGEIHDNNPQIQCVPVILIQRPGSQDPQQKKLGFGSGWDIIVPSGYSLPFWRSFIMLGGRPGGLRETESILHEAGQCVISPDSQSGQNEENRIYKEMRDRYFRLPPNRRVNYLKLGVNSPFRCGWDVLVKEWSGCDDVQVLRDRKRLSHYQDCLQKKTVIESNSITSSLVPVTIRVIGKGNLSPYSLICLPRDGDIRQAKTLFESEHKDPFERERRRLRKENRVNLKRLRRQRVKLKKQTPQDKHTKKSPMPEMSPYTKRMRELWLPSDVDCVRASCDREVMGYLCKAGFSFTEARGTGVGYVTGPALSRLLSEKLNTVLVRNTTSRNYKLATISVITDP